MGASSVQPLRWHRRIPPVAADTALAAALALLAVYEYADPGDDGHQAGSLWLNAPLSVLLLAPLAWRRRAPMAAFLVAHAVVAVPSLVTDHTLFAFSGSFVLAIYLYSVARHCDLATARWAPLVTWVSLTIYSVRAQDAGDVGNLIFGILLFGTCWVIGRVMRRLTLSQEALTRALHQLGREQAQREQLAVLAERTRLARDLHDVVAHAVALMIVQAGAARVVLDDDVEAARRSLLAVERTGREATGDLRRMLGLLRAADEDTLGARPGVDGLEDLIERMGSAGLEVELRTTGIRPPMSASLSMSVHQVVQEALTNALKHAGPTKVLVRLDYGDRLRIVVTDAGPAQPRQPAVSTGHGLLGMQERLAMYGGSVRAGRDDTGFTVDFDLPMSETFA